MTGLITGLRVQVRPVDLRHPAAPRRCDARDPQGVLGVLDGLCFLSQALDAHCATATENGMIQLEVPASH